MLLTVDENVVGTAMQELGLSIPKPRMGWNKNESLTILNVFGSKWFVVTSHNKLLLELKLKKYNK